MTISRWDTQEHIRAVEARAARIRDQAVSGTGLTSPRLETYEETVYA